MRSHDPKFSLIARFAGQRLPTNQARRVSIRARSWSADALRHLRAAARLTAARRARCRAAARSGGPRRRPGCAAPCAAPRPRGARRPARRRRRRWPGLRLERAASCSACRCRSSVVDLVRLEQPGHARGSRAPRRCRPRPGAELAAVEQHPVEGRLRPRAPRTRQLERRPDAFSVAVGRGEQRVLGGPRGRRPPSAAGPARGRARPRARPASCSSTGTLGRKTDAVSPRRRARTNRPTAWAKNSGVDGRRRVDADREPRHVDALGHHPHRDHPALVARRELLDPVDARPSRRRARRRAARR